MVTVSLEVVGTVVIDLTVLKGGKLRNGLGVLLPQDSPLTTARAGIGRGAA